MRLKNSDIQLLTQQLETHLYETQQYKGIVEDLKNTAYQVILSANPVAATLSGLVGTLPKVVKDEITKISSIGYRLEANKYEELVKAAKEKDGITDMPPYPFNGYSNMYTDFPVGKVLYGSSADGMPSFNVENDASRMAWIRLSQAQAALVKANKVVTKASATLTQLCHELGTLDRLIDAVPVIRPLVPLTWLEPPAEAPKTGLVDEETAARLRNLILGETQ